MAASHTAGLNWGSMTFVFPCYEMTMWLKCPGTLSLHFSQSARYPILKLFFMPGCHVQLSMVCLLRMWPLRAGLGEWASPSPSAPCKCERGGDSMSIMALGWSIARDGDGGSTMAASMVTPMPSSTIMLPSPNSWSRTLSSTSEIGDGSLRWFCAACQSSRPDITRGTDWSSEKPEGWWPMLITPLSVVTTGPGPAHSFCWPRTCAAKLGCIGVGIRLEPIMSTSVSS